MKDVLIKATGPVTIKKQNEANNVSMSRTNQETITLKITTNDPQVIDEILSSNGVVSAENILDKYESRNHDGTSGVTNDDELIFLEDTFDWGVRTSGNISTYKRAAQIVANENEQYNTVSEVLIEWLHGIAGASLRDAVQMTTR